MKLMKNKNVALPAGPRAKAAGIAVAVFAALLLALTGIAEFLGPNDLLHARFGARLVGNPGYLEYDDLEKQHWSSLEQVTYEDGEVASTTRYQRFIAGGYRIERTGASGEKTSLEGEAGNNGILYADDAEESGATYEVDLVGRIVGVAHSNYGEDGFETGGWSVVLDWSQQSERKIEKQSLYPEPVSFSYAKQYPEVVEVEGSRTYTAWQDFQMNLWPARVEDLDVSGEFCGYTEYAYGDASCEARAYSATGELLGSAKTTYDWFGRLASRELYDASGALTTSETFHYLAWERYGSMTSVFILFVFTSLALTVALWVDDDRKGAYARKLAAAAEAAEASGETGGEKADVQRGFFASYLVWLPIMVVNSLVVYWLLGVTGFLAMEDSLMGNYDQRYRPSFVIATGLGFALIFLEYWLYRRFRQK